MVRIYPSIVSSDLLIVGETLKQLDSLCAGFHIDCMDNHFVPRLMGGSSFVNTIDHASMHPSWVHCMVEDPISLIVHCTLKEKSIVTVHSEVQNNYNLNEIIDYIKKRGWHASLALSPSTTLEKIVPFLTVCDHVLVMSVQPGFSGQTFMEPILSKVAALNDYKQVNNYRYRIGIDGGINRHTIQKAYHAGVQDFGIAQGIFGAPDMRAEIKYLYQLCP